MVLLEGPDQPCPSPAANWVTLHDNSLELRDADDSTTGGDTHVSTRTHTHQHRRRRGLYLSAGGKPRQPGDVLMASLPFAYVLAPQLWDGLSHCSRCLRASVGRVRRCGTCKMLAYCSVGCQRADWKEHHRHECRALATAIKPTEAGIPPGAWLHDLLLISRCLRSLTSSPHNDTHAASRSEVFVPKRAHVLDLDEAPLPSGPHPLDTCADPFDSVDPTLVTKAQQLQPGIAMLLVHQRDTCPPPTTTEILGLLRRFQTNNFGIVDGLWRAIAAGVYPYGALLNHSCRPNCLLTYRRDASTGMYIQEVRLLRALDPSSGAIELTHSYIDVAGPARPRKRRLWQDYGFWCTCAACTHTHTLENTHDRQALPKAGQADIQGALDLLNSPEAEHNGALADEMKAKLEAVELLARHTNDKRPDLQLELYRARSLVQGIALESGAIDIALTQCRAMVTYLRTAFGDTPHPLVGLQLFTQGDLCMLVAEECASAPTDVCDVGAEGVPGHGVVGNDVIGKNVAATDMKVVVAAAVENKSAFVVERDGCWEEALRILCVTHGSGHDLVQRLREQMAERQQ